MPVYKHFVGFKTLRALISKFSLRILFEFSSVPEMHSILMILPRSNDTQPSACQQ